MRHVTLVFLRRHSAAGSEILLAMKKVRFGAGKWNGPGGKVELGETCEQAAVRECREEINVTPRNLQKTGELHFFDLPDTEHYCHIYVTTEWDGEPAESEEMRPRWFAESKIPYDQMWPDDKLWLPLLLAGKRFRGKVVIDQDHVRESELREVTAL